MDLSIKFAMQHVILLVHASRKYHMLIGCTFWVSHNHSRKMADFNGVFGGMTTCIMKT